jgi:hypothetical protein
MAQTKQDKERILLAVLLVVAALIWYFYFGRSNTAGGGVTAAGSYAPINAEDYSVIFKDLGESQSTVYKSTGRNIFVAGSVPVAEQTAAAAAAVRPAEKPRPIMGPMPPPEPPLPVLSMKFFGYGSLPTSGPRRAFLLDGEEIHIVQEGDTVQNHIRITHIGNDRIEYEDTVTGKKNSTNLEAPPQA